MSQPADPPRPPAEAPDRLEQVCTGLASLLRAPAGTPTAGSCDLAAVRDALAGIIQGGASELAGKLREELQAWSDALGHLRRLSGCRYLPPPPGLAGVGDGLEQAWQEVQQVLDALDNIGGPALPLRRPTPLGLPARSEPAEPALEAEEVPPPAEIEERGPSPAIEEPWSDSTPGAAEAQEVQALFALAESVLLRRDYERAVALYTEVLRRAPDHRNARFRRGQIHLFRGRAQRAVEDFTTVLLAAPRDVECLLFRGDAHAVLTRQDEAIADYSRCLELDPTRERARYNRAVTYRLRGDLRTALAEWNAILEAQPEQAGAYYNRGLVYAALEFHDRAIADLTRALELNPEYPEARTRLREVRKAQRERAPVATAASPAPGPGVATPGLAPPVPQKKVGSAAPDTAVRLKCPACGVEGAIRWEKMGRVHACRGCGRTFRVGGTGALVEVVRIEGDRWVDRALHESRSRRARVVRWLTRGVGPLAGLAAAILITFLVIRVSSAPAVPTEAPLPRELQPRVELFTKAWLKKDWALMRRLVTPGEDRNLYRWSTRHPPPGSGGDGRIEVSILGTQEGRATVRVKIHGVGKAGLEYPQLWEERGDTWYFMVPAR